MSFKFETKVYGSTDRQINAHNWCIENFGESFSWKTKRIDRWTHGYHDDGYVSLRFKKQEDLMLFALMWNYYE